MVAIEGKYLGELRTEAIHLQSSTTLITDAPTDNQGRGEAFSPTDLVCAALGSCMLTVMGIIAKRDGIDMIGIRFEVTKFMASSPRRISKIIVHFSWPDMPELEEAQLAKLKKAALTCPVALSLHQEIIQDISFGF